MNVSNIGAHMIVELASLTMRCWDPKLCPLNDQPGMVLDLLLSQNGLVMFVVIIVREGEGGERGITGRRRFKESKSGFSS